MTMSCKNYRNDTAGFGSNVAAGCSCFSSSSSAMLNRAIDLNNEGVSLLIADGDSTKKGIAKLTEALSIVRNELTVGLHQLPPSSTVVEEGQHMCCDNLEGALPVLPVQLPMSDLHDSNYFIYNRCMIIQDCQHLGCSSDTVPQYAACIVLNLGLAFHRLGNRGHRESLVKAERMYVLALQLLNSPFWVTKTSVLCMQIIATTNLARIHQERCQYDEARGGIGRLSTFLRNEASLSASSSFFSAQDMQELSLNVVMWDFPKLAAAA